ncbi:hypothetical protein [Novosphingobium sp.]|uniref:hypothetical protein n=1 Tax=Novosphingobium sp. TaxID=1874826 RepID=UPI0025E2ACD5|nr:hypothetical protein [Novosphingobium sp.]MCC6926153.1 hypothetical protein [Novosphingobium sp.]
MAGFLFALLASMVVSLGARDQAIVASLSARQGARGAVLAIAVLCAVLSAAAAGWAGAQAAPLLAPRARAMLVAMVLGLAALELLVVRPLRKPAEPTHSLFAFAAVLLAQQLTDATRFVVFALAAASVLPWGAALGGALGSAAMLLAAWSAGEELESWPLLAVRRGIGLLLAAIALYLAF